MYSEFERIVHRLKEGRLWDFPGGVHPDQRKTLSNQESITTIPLASKFYVTVKQHIGVEGHLVVDVGDKVLKGQKLTTSMNPFAVPVHAPTSGTVTEIEKHVSAHPSALPEQTIIIEPDKFDTWCELTPFKDYQDKPKAKVIEAICSAGITGMGGAGFPTHLKASPKKDVEFLIINGIECEPYITADDRLMREHAWQIRQGIDVLVHLLSPKQVLIAIEDNKPEAIEAMQVACQESENYLVCQVPTKYPAGGEKQLIQVLTNREVPQQGLPIDVGVIMQNVGTCFAIADAIISGKPLIQRVVTLTGEALDRHGNAWVPVGTPISHLLAQAEYHPKRQKDARIIMGGPMMGFSVSSEQVPVVKSTNCILVPADNEIPTLDSEQACIRCGACADACPASLLPQQLYWHSKAKELDKAQEYNLSDCIECGACAFVCPSEIPLVHYYRIAKAEIRAEEEERSKAEKAKERFEARKERLQRDAQEREEKHRKAAEARKQAMNKDDSGAKDKIAAALARAKAKKQAAQGDEKTTAEGKDTAVAEKATPSKSDKVAAAIARAKAKKEAAKSADSSSKTESSSASATASEEKKDKVAAAIARAKAKKLAAQSAQTTDETLAPSEQEQDEKKDKIAAAIARAKAKKQAAQEASEKPADTEQQAATPEPADANNKDDKKQKIAAAVARAKAKKLAAQKASSEETSIETSQQQESVNKPPVTDSAEKPEAEPVVEKKQDKIAAAIAKAKAKKAAREKAEQQQDEK